MTDKLPPNLLQLFAPRPALRYVPPTDFAQEERRTHEISGVAQFLPALHSYEDNYKPTLSWLQMRDRKKLEKRKAQEHLKTEGYKLHKPDEDPNIKGDALKTLFLARLSYDTDQKDLEREFGRYGAIVRIRIVTDSTAADTASKKKKFKGYAFIEYERERDMKTAYKEAENVTIKGRRVLVDVERGRTVKDWRPMRFGGGLGGRGYTKAPVMRPGNYAPSGPGQFRGGFRGGFRGDFQRGGGGFRGGRGGYDRGGFDRGGGGRGGYDRGGYSDGGRGGVGFQSNGGFGAPPNGAPAGPRGGGGGYGGRSYEDRDRGTTGSNAEPVRPRDRGGYGDRDRGGYKDRDDRGDRDGDRDRYSRKREYEGGSYNDDRSKRRY